MTYFNPDTYDPDKLEGPDKDLMRGYDIAAEEALDFLDGCAEDAETGVEAFDEVYRQVVAQARGQLAARLDASRIELTVALMEDSPEVYAQGGGADEPPAPTAMPSGMRAGLYGDWASKLGGGDEGSCADE